MRVDQLHKASHEIADLTSPDEQVVVAPSGDRGNIHSVTSVRRAPAFAERERIRASPRALD